MKNNARKKLLCIIASICILTACGTTQEKPATNPSDEIVKGSKSNPPSTEESIIQYHRSVLSDPDYALPTENVLIYKQYSMEDLIKNSPSGGGLMDNDLIPIFIDTPHYPASAFENKEQGDVIAEFTAPTIGKIKQLKILSTPKNLDFQKNALQSLQHWAYAPPKVKNTKYTVANIKVKIEFRIENDKPVIYFKDETNNAGFYPPGPIQTQIN
ncbi:MAG TPA: hypothetical protein DIW64_18585 [Cellvibrio sp.]|nr:hypothetical protein [Cellvibrio sp.]